MFTTVNNTFTEFVKWSATFSVALLKWSMKMEFMAGFGGVGALIGIFWVVAGFMIPFMIWSIYRNVYKIAADVAACRKLITAYIADSVEDAGGPKNDGLLRDL